MLRFAQSPTGDMDVGNLRVALFNYMVSKQKNEDLIIRIDDTNKEKNIENKDKEILELINLFGIEHSRVIIQSENIKYHTGMAMNLLLDKKAFNCFCSKEVLAEEEKQAKKENRVVSYSGFCETISDETKFNCNAPFVVRLKKPEANVEFVDTFNGKKEYTPDEVDSVIVLNFDKSPTSDFACAVDEMLYDISTVIRSEEFIDNSAKQIQIRKAIGYDKELEYIHIPALLNKQNTKKNTKIYVKDLIADGYLPAAIANYLISLSFDTPKEIFSVEEAIEWFDIKTISKEQKKFDMEKLKEINIEHLKTLDNMRLSKLLSYADEDIGALAKVYLDEFSTIKELKQTIDKIFAKRDTLESFEKEYENLKTIISQMDFINEYKDFEATLKDKSGLDGDKFFTSLRYILTGSTAKIDLAKVYPCIKNYLGEIV